MTKKLRKIATTLSIVALVLMLAMLVSQFLPFWSAGEDSASIGVYLLHPDHYKEITNFFKDFFKTYFGGAKFSMNYIYLTPIVILASCIIGIVICITKRDHFSSFILPSVGGIYGATGYLQNYLFQIGQNWQLHVALCIATGVIGCIGLVISAVRFFRPIEK